MRWTWNPPHFLGTGAGSPANAMPIPAHGAMGTGLRKTAVLSGERTKQTKDSAAAEKAVFAKRAGG